MKFPAIKTKIFGLTALLGTFGSLVAIERPNGEKEKEEIPAIPSESQDGILRTDQKDEKSNEASFSEKSAYLGVGGEPAGEALLMHLNLKSGMLLRTIDPTSPAGLAGLQENDILEEVDGKELSDQDSLRDVLSAEKPGDEILLKLIRRGKSVDQKVTLGEAPVRQNAGPFALIPEHAADMNRLLEEQLGNALGGLGNAELQKELMEQLEKALGDQGAGFKRLRLDLGADLLNGEDMKMGIQGLGSMRLEDEEGSVEMKIQDGQRELAIRDKEGKLLFEGPYDSEIDEAAVPEEYRERVGRLDTGSDNSFRLKLNEGDQLKRLRQKKQSK